MTALSSHRSNQHRDYDLGFSLTHSPGKGIVRVSDVQEWVKMAKLLPLPSFSSAEIPNLRVTSLQAVQADSPNTLLLLVVEGLDLIHNHFECKEIHEGYMQVSRILVVNNRYQVTLIRSENAIKAYDELMALGKALSLINGKSKFTATLAIKAVEDAAALLGGFFTELTSVRWNTKDHEQAKRLRLVQ